MDRTARTDNPLDASVLDDVARHLISIRTPLGGSYEKYIAAQSAGKRALDIGICEHTLERMASPAWKHAYIRTAAAYSLGIDIIEPLVAKLVERGVNARVCDATSDVFLGQTFDVVHAGDVIEHVDSAVALLKFCKRHMNKGAKLIVRTPNVYNFDYVWRFKKYGTDRSNLEHVCYITPTHALELGRRVGLRLSGYKVIYPRRLTARGIASIVKSCLRGKPRHALAEVFAKPEVYSTIYVFEFTND